MPQPRRSPWSPLPDIALHALVPVVKAHPDYRLAKAGDADAAFRLVEATVSPTAIDRMRRWASPGVLPVLLPVHAAEQQGVNAIPLALAEALGRELRWPVCTDVVQLNVVGHTGASGFSRLARQAIFDGAVSPDTTLVLVDDFVGQGGTLANLRGHVTHQGASVIGASVLTGKPHSVHLSLTPSTLHVLRRTHGSELEAWWNARFGHAFDCLTESEARYLCRTPDPHRIRAEVAAAER